MEVLTRTTAVCLVALACATVPPARTRVAGLAVHFVHRAPGARSVAVVGSFNAWTPTPMKLNGAGAFETHLPLSPGLHRFAFQVTFADGQVTIEAPQAADGYENDGFGSKNGVLDVGAADSLPGNFTGLPSSEPSGIDRGHSCP